MKPTTSNWQRRLPWLILALALAYYAIGIGRWMAYDDEGGYFYAAWRIGQGEMPYRDFLSPQLPFFLYPGALLLKLMAESVLALRMVSALAVAFSGLLLQRTVQRVPAGGALAGMIAMIVYLSHRDAYWSARFFRAEATMLLYSMAGLYLLVRAYPGCRRGLVLSGLFFGLASATRLFGFLPFGGACLFLVWDAVRAALADRASARVELRNGLSRLLWLAVPFALTVGGIFGLMLALTPNFFDAILGHHLKQGADLGAWQVFLKGLALYGSYVLRSPLLLLLALPTAWAILRAPVPADDAQPAARLNAVFACQLPTALAFLVLSRDLEGRHMVHLVPSLAALFGIGLSQWLARWSLRPRWGHLGAPALAVATVLAAVPSVVVNREVRSWKEDSTPLLAAYIQSLTGPDEYVLSDYPGLNFHARRKNTRSGAGLSRGATEGGQIKGADLINEIIANDVRLVIVNVAQGAHQMAGLHDYDAFHNYINTHLWLIGRAVYDYRLLEFYYADDQFPERPNAEFGGLLQLNGMAPGDQLMDVTDARRLPGKMQAEAGSDWVVTLRWRALAPMGQDYYLVLRLVDEQGREWGLGQRQLLTEDRDVYLDENEGLQAVMHPTSEWRVGEMAMDFFKLPVLAGTPPGEYKVLARLRTLDEWNGLPVVTASGEAVSLDYTLGTLTVTRPAVPPPVSALGAMGTLDTQLGPLELLGFAPITPQVRPGDVFNITLFWRALRNVTEDWQILLTLEDARGRTLGEELLEPATGHPTDEWSEGELVRGQYRLQTAPAGLESAGQGRLVLTGVDRATGRMFPQGGIIIITPVEVLPFPRLFDVPTTIQHRLDASFEDQVTLLGYDLETGPVSVGDTVNLTLYWQAQQRMDRSYTVFTHLLGSRGLWGQKDSLPVQGTHPTTGWLTGEVIVDKIAIPVREGAPPGEYDIEVGLYELETGKRLLVAAPGGGLTDHLLLPGVVVQ